MVSRAGFEIAGLEMHECSSLFLVRTAIANLKTDGKTLKHHILDDTVEQKDRLLQHIILATPNTKVAREGQV